MVADRCLVLLLELPLSVGVIPEVTLGADKQDGNARTMMRHLMRIMKFMKSVKNGNKISQFQGKIVSKIG